MRSILSQIDLVIECRDYRIPVTSRNPLFEEDLLGKERLIVYTKQDLGSHGRQVDIEVILSLKLVTRFSLQVLTFAVSRESN